MKNKFKYFLLITIGALPFVSFSAALNVSPVHVHFAAGDKIETLALSNPGDTPVTFQTQVYQWQQKNNQDIENPTQDIIASPLVFTIAPHSKQLLRVAVRDTKLPTPAKQKTYRLILTQILPLSIASKKAEETIQTKLKISLPVFIDPIKETTLLTVAKESKNIILTNGGNTTILISKIQWLNNTDPIGKDKPVFIYLLPGSQYSLAFVDKATAIQVTADKKIDLLELR
jgi:fimbrial chaperone protein